MLKDGDELAVFDKYNPAREIWRGAIRLREHGEAARRGEQRTAVLYALSRDLAAARDTETILRAAVAHIHEVFYSQVMILLPDVEDRVMERASAAVTYYFDERERIAAAEQHLVDRNVRGDALDGRLPGLQAARQFVVGILAAKTVAAVNGADDGCDQEGSRLILFEQAGRKLRVGLAHGIGAVTRQAVALLGQR